MPPKSLPIPSRLKLVQHNPPSGSSRSSPISATAVCVPHALLFLAVRAAARPLSLGVSLLGWSLTLYTLIIQ